MKAVIHKTTQTSHLFSARTRRPTRVTSSATSSIAAQIHLAKIIDRQEDGCRVRIGGAERTVAIDPAVDPALLDEATVSGAWAVVALGLAPCVVGLLCTRRSVAIDRDGNVDAEVKQFRVSAEETLIKTSGAFLQLKEQEIELYGQRIVSRARELLRLLGRMIKLN